MCTGASSLTQNLEGHRIKAVYMKFQNLTVSSMKTTIFWDVVLCNLVEIY
jgi:hypothetical protein